MNIDEILTGLESFDFRYKRKLVEAAVSKKDEITPHLIKILEQVKDDPEKYLKDPDNDSYIYALMLLGHFQESQAHQVIIDLFSLPEPIPHDLFGDILTESLPMVLLQTCAGSLEGIKSLILNKNAYEFSRSSAVTAMSYAVVAEISSREEVLSFFGGLFTGDEAPRDSSFHSQLACSICDLYPESLIDVLNDAFAKGLIDEMFVSQRDVQESLDQGEEECLTRLRNEMISSSLDDVHKSMEWWACYQPENPKPIPSQPKINQSWNQPKPKAKKKKEFWEL